ncbi:carbohydrate ABC transporter substrate-binding protein, CUT1 family [Phyllobacterium sp. CL33Tsu]|uniref:ABC transporter substrate-binding protein n=1 Tax=Phyllobacterium sp. CL33Tsu TaxID=1798191 RepID=UPI0008E426A9|nr:extracellular solute-binding protein [Phyllobacterium sp. CL33Tsu]SFJ28429.1 carbohydrate ABC transporter substrate-binding protein, CUT1 family [Phyllobacterium sp. CL33Tsu]
MMFEMTRRGILAAVICGMAFSGTNWAEAADSPYKGVTVRFLTSSNASQDAFSEKIKEIGAAWGMNVEIRKLTTDELQKKVVLDYVAGADTWDLVYSGGVQRTFQWYNQGIFDDLAPLIAKYGDKKLLDWDGISESGRGAVMLDDHIMGLTIAASDQALAYRKDLFENPEEQAAFKAKYGYDLKPPVTYEQYHDMAAFFTRKKGEKLAGKVLDNDSYGLINSNKKGTFLWHDYENQLMAFGAQVCDPKTMKAGLTSPESIKAAEYYKSLIPYWPPDHINMASGETMALFAAGRVAMNIEYFDRVVYTMGKGEGAITSEQVGYTYPPTEDNNARSLKHPYRAGPAVISIFSRSKNKEAAYKLLEAASSLESQVDMARKTLGFMPSRTAALETLKGEMPYLQYLIDVANGGADALSDAQEMPYPCILASSEIGDAVSDAISQILIGGEIPDELEKAQAKAQKALDKVRGSLAK